MSAVPSPSQIKSLVIRIFKRKLSSVLDFKYNNLFLQEYQELPRPPSIWHDDGAIYSDKPSESKLMLINMKRQ